MFAVIMIEVGGRGEEEEEEEQGEGEGGGDGRKYFKSKEKI